MNTRTGRMPAPSNLRHYPLVPGTPLHDLLSEVAREIIRQRFITEPPTPMRYRRNGRRKNGH